MKNVKRKISKTGILFSLFLSTGTYSLAQNPPQNVASSLATILENATENAFTKPGGVMAVVVPGQWTWTGASGYAISGLTAGQAESMATPTSKFRVGSITKTMLATCVMKLEQQGLLSIDDPISDYLRASLINDTLMPSGTILIRHLLNHTSGISNSADNMGCQSEVLSNPEMPHSLEYAIYCGASQGEIFEPGYIWAYSNTNYSLLAMLVERVSGQSYESYLTENIITPLGLSQTEIPTSNQIGSPHMGCYWNIGSWIDLTIINPSNYKGWADVVSTTEDLNHFYEALLSGEIINATELARMKTVDEAAFDYGMGLDFYTYTGVDYFGHYGEVANTSGMFFVDMHSALAPNGYYISYNFNTQGVDMQTLVDQPVIQLMKSSLGLGETAVEMKIDLYPNPANTSCTVRLNSLSEKSTLSLFDLQGREVLNQSIEADQKELVLDLSGFKNSVYTLKISGETSSSTQKLIIAH